MTTLKHHSKVGRTVRLAVGLLLVAFTLLAGTVPAQAAGPAFDYPAAVDPGSIELSRTGDPDAPLNTGHRLQVTATWSVPDSAQGGETFGLTLPEEFSGYTGEFAIPATDDPTQTVANCVVSSGRAGTVTCTLTDYVNERSDVRGELWFVVLVEKATQEDEVKFVVDDEVTLVELPGPGGIVGVSPLSPDYFKGGWIGQDGSLGWQVHFPGAQVEALPSVVVEDHLTPAGATTQEHYGVEGSIRVSSKTETGISERITNWTGGWNEDKTSFRIEIPGPFNPDASYYVVYHTEPIVTAEGDIYANEATISGVQVKAQQTWSASGGGNGIGKALGQFALSKLVTGTSATAVPSDTAFTVNYSYGDPVEERSMTVLADGTAVYSARVPDGTVVTLEEVNLPDVPGVVWGTPKFTGPGITELGDGRAQIALHEGGAVSLSLTNDAGETPPIPEEPITPEEPCTPGVPGTPAEPGTPEEPCVPEEPVTPEEPCTPGVPGTPAEPGTPEEPCVPEEPVTPEEPCTPGVPGTPAEPGTPEEPCVPEEPVTPEEPCTPGVPGTPAEPGTPEDSCVPEEAVTPNRSIDSEPLPKSDRDGAALAATGQSPQIWIYAGAIVAAILGATMFGLRRFRRGE